MSHLSRPYVREEHRPDDFLGRFVDLPELESLPCRPVLERPITSLSDALEFLDRTVMVYGYDQYLPQEKWGVWQARYLEAAWWRLQDAASKDPLLPHAWSPEVRGLVRSGPGPGCVAIHLDSYSDSGRTFMTHLSFSFFSGTLEDREFLDLHREEGWPRLPPENQVLGIPGLAEREKFWEPLNAYSVCQAMDSWRAVRFEKNRFVVEFLGHPAASPCESFSKTFGDAAGAHLREFLLGRAIPGPVASPALTRPTRL